MRVLLWLFLLTGMASAQIPTFGAGEAPAAAKLNAALIWTLNTLSTGSGIASTSSFYQPGAGVTRLGDRLFVGAAADNPAHSNRDDTPTDWLTTVMGAHSTGAWALWGAQGASIARYGTTGWLSASRTSDAVASSAMLGYTPSSIGQSSWCIADSTANPTTATCYGGYDESWRMSGVNYQPTFGREIEVVNFGGSFAGTSNPYHVNNGGGTYAVQIGCGGGQTSGTSDCDAGLTFVKNNDHFAKAIVIGSDALAGVTGLVGDSGFASGIDMGRNQAITWRTPETVGGAIGGNAGLFIRSTVSAVANSTRWEAQDSGVVFSNTNGQQLFAISTAATAINSLYLQPGTSSGQAAGIYAAPGGGGNGNIGLFPSSGAELQISSPTCGAGGSTPATATTGFLSINVNGSDVRVALYTPGQVGC